MVVVLSPRYLLINLGHKFLLLLLFPFEAIKSRGFAFVKWTFDVLLFLHVTRLLLSSRAFVTFISDKKIIRVTIEMGRFSVDSISNYLRFYYYRFLFHKLCTFSPAWNETSIHSHLWINLFVLVLINGSTARIGLILDCPSDCA